jgi:predicted nucleic acid-binding protein
VIYIDSSVFLARVFAEEISPPDAFWDAPLTSSRLLLYEVRTRVHARQDRFIYSNDVEMLMDHVRLIALADDILERALRPYPISLRTLDALHLATMEFLRRQGQPVELASYDQRLLDTAAALGIGAASL